MVGPLEGRDGSRGILDLVLGCTQRRVEGSHSWNVSASDTTEVIGVLGKSVTFHTPNTDANPAFWNFGNEAIVTVAFEDPPRPLFSQDKFKTHFAVSERGRALTISQLRMEDAGTYSVTINGKRSTFTLQVFMELAEPTVTCEAQNCSGGSCSSSLRCSASGTGLGNVSYTWRVRDQDMDGSSVVLQVNETFQDGLELVTCTARNPVSSKSITITNLGQLCAGALSSGQVEVRVWAGVGVIVVILVLALLLIFLMVLRKFKGEFGADL
ncbi:T-lymphocyte surface antigen Ly-9-like [Zonotrichia albicollis]|uniref:T-lymphocyte surface antigen Ly-9-like n=1 Tax=Zonotrichia albicollis TaxID=44394 RepID=UPI003D810DB0